MTTNLLDEYADVFYSGLGTLPGKVHLHVKEGAKPVQCSARRVPVTLKPKLKSELDRMVERGVICPIEEPTEWCNQISIQTKKDASLRVCIDPRHSTKFYNENCTHYRQWKRCHQRCQLQESCQR